MHLAINQKSIRYALKGASYLIVSACSSGNYAVIDAICMIQQENVNIIICGGIKNTICRTCVSGFLSMRVLSTK